MNSNTVFFISIRFLKYSNFKGFVTSSLGQSSSLLAGPAILRYTLKVSSFINGVQIAVITYSYRSMEDPQKELADAKALGASQVTLKHPSEMRALKTDRPRKMAREIWPGGMGTLLFGKPFN